PSRSSFPSGAEAAGTETARSRRHPSRTGFRRSTPAWFSRAISASRAVSQPREAPMDMQKFFSITHREHVVCNPASVDKLARLVALLRLPADARVVDIACGKGELLIRLAEAYAIRGIGIDISPFFVADAQRQLQMRARGAE